MADDYAEQLATGRPAQSPVNPKADFIAAHNRAQTGGDSDYALQLTGGSTPPPASAAAAPAPAAGAPAAAAAPPQKAPMTNKPIGQTVMDYVSNIARAAYVPEGQRQDKTLWDALSNGIEGVPAEVGRQFTDALSQMRHDTLPNSWKEVMDNLSSPIPFMVKPGLDALNLAFAPLTGALTSAVGRPVEYETGVNRNITGTLLSMISPGGLIGKAGKLLKGAEAVEGAAGAAGAAETAAKAAEAGPEIDALKAPAAEIKASTPEGQAAQAATGAGGAAAVKAAQEGARVAPFNIMGENPLPDLKLTTEQETAFGDFLSGKAAISPIGLTMETLADPQAISDTVTDISKRMPPGIAKSDDVLRMNAYAMAHDTSANDIMNMKAVAGNADDIMAAQRMVLENAMQKFRELAVTAKATGDPAAFDDAKRALALVFHYSDLWDAGGTPAGRVLRTRQVLQGSSSKILGDIDEMIRASKGQGTIPFEEIINKTAELKPETVSPWIATLRRMTSREGMLYGWYNWLLSNPAVIIKKSVSDTSLAMFNIATRYTAEKLGPKGAIAPGEAAQLFYGYIGSWQEALQIAGKALRSGEGQFHAEFNSLEDGTANDRISRLANGAPANGYGAEEVTRPAFAALACFFPTSWIAGMDDLAKVANYRAEVRAGAWRQATAELGPDAKFDAINQRAAELRNNVPESLHNDAIARALKNTLQEPLSGPAKTMQDWIDQLNVPIPKLPGVGGVSIPVGRIISPFTKISANIARFAYRSSPLPFVLPSALWREDMLAGGARKALAQAQAGLGTGASLVALPFVLNGSITGGGPTSQAERYAWLNAGNKPYSITLPGGASFTYNKVEPFGMSLGAIADTVELMRYAHEDDAAALAASLALGIGHAMLNKTYMQSWSDLVDAMSDPNQKGSKFVDQLAASFAVPSVVSGIDRLFDDNMRAHQGLIETIAARTPGFSNFLPPIRDVWGDPVKKDSGMLHGVGRFLAPFDLEMPHDAEPINKWVWDHRADFPDSEQGRIGFTPPGRVFHVEDMGAHQNINLTTRQADDLKVLAGNGLKLPAGDSGETLGAKDALNALVSGKYPDEVTQERFNSSSGPAQAMMLLSMFNAYKRAANNQFKVRPDIKAKIDAGREVRAKQLAPPSESENPGEGSSGGAVAEPTF